MYCNRPSESFPLCSVCEKPVPLEIAKTDESGKAIHEDCYLTKLCLHPVGEPSVPTSNNLSSPDARQDLANIDILNTKREDNSAA
jgi:hypothetical protein